MKNCYFCSHALVKSYAEYWFCQICLCPNGRSRYMVEYNLDNSIKLEEYFYPLKGSIISIVDFIDIDTLLILIDYDRNFVIDKMPHDQILHRLEGIMAFT